MILLEGLKSRVFPFDRKAAEIYPLVVLQRRILGLATPVADCQVAAIAGSRGAMVATKDTGDFVHSGIDIINPWTD